MWPRKKEPPAEDPEDELAEGLAESTLQIEAEKERRKLEREERKQRREEEAQRKNRERWVAPVILAITFLISLLLRLWNS